MRRISQDPEQRRIQELVHAEKKANEIKRLSESGDIDKVTKWHENDKDVMLDIGDGVWVKGKIKSIENNGADLIVIYADTERITKTFPVDTKTLIDWQEAYTEPLPELINE